MLAADVVVRAVDAALELREITLSVVRRRACRADVLVLLVVHRLVGDEALTDSSVRWQAVGVEDRLRRVDLFLHCLRQRFARYRRHHAGAHFAAVWLDQREACDLADPTTSVGVASASVLVLLGST